MGECGRSRIRKVLGDVQVGADFPQQRLVDLLLPGDVHDQIQNQNLLLCLHGAEANLNGNLAAILAPPVEVSPYPH